MNLTFRLAYDSKGGLPATYTDGLTMREFLLYLKALADEKEKEDERIRLLTGG